jgi:Glycosyl hydrolase family 12
MTFPSGHWYQRASRNGGRSGHVQQVKPRRSAVRRPRAALATALGVAVVGAAAVTTLAAGSAHAATTTLTGSQSTPVADGAYTVQNNEWGSSAPQSIATDGDAGFTVANSSIDNATNGAPGGYPSIYAGCHWGDCTHGGLAANPVQVSTLTHPGTVTTSWSTAQPGGSAAYDVAYDIWFNQTPTTSGQPNGTELMIWLNHNGPVQPFGSQVASNVSIGGRSYNVWYGRQAWNTVSYTMTSGTTSVRNLDIGAVTADAVNRGYIQKSWYLIDVEAGFELWQGGAGLATNSFSVNLNGRSPSPTPALTPRPTPAPTPAPSPTSARTISLQAISPDPTTPGTATNVTVDFKNTGPAMASNLTLVIKVRNSVGTVVGSQSWRGQNLPPQTTLNETYTWTAASPAGYTVEGLVQDSSGRILQQAQAATVTVKLRQKRIAARDCMLPGPASTSMTCRPSTPNSADAVLRNTMPAAF